MPDAAGGDGCAAPDLTSFGRLESLGLVVTSQRVTDERAVLACRVVPAAGDGWCGHGGGTARVPDPLVREPAHLPVGWRPTMLAVTVRRYACAGRGRTWLADTSRAGEPRASLSRGALGRWKPW